MVKSLRLGTHLRQRMRRGIYLAAATAGTQLGFPGIAACEEILDGKTVLKLEEIIVTATRRAENAQRTPIAISVVLGDVFPAAGITNIQRAAELVPALDVAPSAGPYNSFTIRGVNNFAVNFFSESAIAVNFNGVYISRPTATNSGLFYDLERVEILKGPQGTLYGRNATGGAVNIISNRPAMEFQSAFNAEVGNYDRTAIDAMVNVPLGRRAAIRVAGQTAEHDAYFSDGTGDERASGGRLSIGVLPSEDLSIVLTADYSHQSGRGGGSAPIDVNGEFIGGDPWRGLLAMPELIRTGPPTNAALPPPSTYQDNDFAGVSAEIEWNTAAGTLTIIPGYRDVRTDFLNVAGGFYINEQADSDQSSLEARFASNTNRTLRYILGVYAFDENIRGTGFFDQSLQGVSRQNFELGTESYAAFGQVTAALTDAVSISVGSRYTRDRRAIDGQTFSIAQRFLPPNPPPNSGTLVLSLDDASNTFDATTWSVSAEWDVTENSYLYSKVETGFKAGGFFSGPLGSNTFDPEEVTAYVIGSKNRFLDDRLQVNAEVFFLDYEDQQISHLDRRLGPGGVMLTVQATENVGRSTIKGAEIEVDYLLTGTTEVEVRAQYLEAVYDELSFRVPQLGPQQPPFGCSSTPSAGFFIIDCSGRQSTQAPKWTTDLGVLQRIPLHGAGDISLSLRSRYQSERETRINYLPQTRADDYTRTDASISFSPSSATWSVALFCDNIEDDAVISNTFVHASFPSVNLITASLEPPRTYGVRASARF